jgi:hypothetical protein
MAKKKTEHLPELSEMLIELDPNDASATILELDELWSNARKKGEYILDLDCFV